MPFKILSVGLALVILVSGAGVTGAAGGERRAVVYYNEACDECATYVQGELNDILATHNIELVKKDYINQKAHRQELNELTDRLEIPVKLQSHLATFIDESRIILQGEPPRRVVEALLTSSRLPERILVYGEEGGDGRYQAWAFAGPVKSYPADEPVETFLNWFDANRGSLAAKTDSTAGRAVLLPAVLLTGLVDGINPCAMVILLFFISFLFTIHKSRVSAARMGAVYITAVYVVYFLVGLGLLKASTLFQGHWLGQAGAGLLMVVGMTNLVGAIFPKFPIRLEVPEVGKEGLKKWMHRATLPASLVLGTLMGLESFPCSGGPYVAILGLLGNQAGFWEGLSYLALYNLMFVVPLVVVLGLSLNPVMGRRIQTWERSSSRAVRGMTGGVMAVMGLGLLIWLS